MPTSSIDWPAVRAAGHVPARDAAHAARAAGSGERLGAGTGSSLEFQDYRPYAPGDDLRHVDWAAYARSEVLAVRLYREEVAPRIDLVLDISRSMAVTEQKLRAYGELSGLLACACASTVADSRVITTSARRSRSRCTCPKTSSASSPATPALSALEGGAPAVPPPLAARRRQRFSVSARRRRARLAAGARQRAGWRSCSSRCARKRSRPSKAAAGWSTSKAAASSIS